MVNINKYLLKTIILLPIYLFADENIISISSNKVNYLVYEPIYLEMKLINNENNIIFGSLEEMNIDMYLEIIKGSDVIRYESPIKVDKVRDIAILDNRSPFKKNKSTNKIKYSESNYIEYDVVFITGNKVITEEPGIYQLRLRMKKQPNRTISNTLNLYFNKPQKVEDINAIKLIDINPKQYALCVYLEGGDHLKDGIKILKELINTNSEYSNTAELIMSINNSHSYFDWKENKILREPQGKDMDKYLDNIGNVNKDTYLKLRLIDTIIKHTKNNKLNENILNKAINVLYNINSDKIKATRLYRETKNIICK